MDSFLLKMTLHPSLNPNFSHQELSTHRFPPPLLKLNFSSLPLLWLPGKCNGSSAGFGEGSKLHPKGSSWPHSLYFHGRGSSPLPRAGPKQNKRSHNYHPEQIFPAPRKTPWHEKEANFQQTENRWLFSNDSFGAVYPEGASELVEYEINLPLVKNVNSLNT